MTEKRVPPIIAGSASSRAGCVASRGMRGLRDGHSSGCRYAVGLLTVADVLDIAVGVLAVLVVRRLTRMRLRRAA